MIDFNIRLPKKHSSKHEYVLYIAKPTTFTKITVTKTLNEGIIDITQIEKKTTTKNEEIKASLVLKACPLFRKERKPKL